VDLALVLVAAKVLEEELVAVEVPVEVLVVV